MHEHSLIFVGHTGLEPLQGLDSKGGELWEEGERSGSAPANCGKKGTRPRGGKLRGLVGCPGGEVQEPIERVSYQDGVDFGAEVRAKGSCALPLSEYFADVTIERLVIGAQCGSGIGG